VISKATFSLTLPGVDFLTVAGEDGAEDVTVVCVEEVIAGGVEEVDGDEVFKDDSSLATDFFAHGTFNLAANDRDNFFDCW